VTDHSTVGLSPEPISTSPEPVRTLPAASPVVPRQRRAGGTPGDRSASAAPSTLERPDRPARPGTPGRLQALGSWSTPTAVTLALGLWSIGTPGAWTDEMATWGAVRLSYTDLAALSRHIDAVMSPYYAVMHLWAVLFGASDTALRIPSVLALTAACALLVRLGGRVASPRAGLLAGYLFALTPTVSRYAQEQRMYAFAVLGAVLSTLLLHRALERPSWRRFTWYAGAMTFVGLTHVIALLIVLAHVVPVILAGRAVLRRWAVACVVFGALLAPLLFESLRQRGQVRWIAPVGLAQTPSLFAGIFGSAAVTAVLVVLALLVRTDTRVIVLLAGWAVAPIAGLWALSLYNPLLVPRYLLFVVPAWALLAGLALAEMSSSRVVAVLIVFGMVGLPAQVVMRQPDGHGQGTRAAAAIILERAHPGDAIAYSLSDGRGTWVARDVVARYVPAQRRPDDVFQTGPQRVNGKPWADECPDPAACLGDRARVWVIRNGHYPDPLAEMTPVAKEGLLRSRYRVESIVHPAGLTVALLVAVNA
jgi:mannosyltransferase